MNCIPGFEVVGVLESKEERTEIIYSIYRYRIHCKKRLTIYLIIPRQGEFG